MKFLLDENFPKAAAELLERFGHDSYDPRGTELEGSEDSVLVEEAQRLDAVILTTDRDSISRLATSDTSLALFTNSKAKRQP